MQGCDISIRQRGRGKRKKARTHLRDQVEDMGEAADPAATTVERRKTGCREAVDDGAVCRRVVGDDGVDLQAEEPRGKEERGEGEGRKGGSSVQGAREGAQGVKAHPVREVVVAEELEHDLLDILSGMRFVQTAGKGEISSKVEGRRGR